MTQNIDFQQFMKKLAEERNNIVNVYFEKYKYFMVISFKFQ